MVENSIYSCFLVSEFLAAFAGDEVFFGVLTVERMPGPDILKGRERFHADCCGETDWDDEKVKEWERLYQPLDAAGQAMIEQYGLPVFSMSHHSNTVFLGDGVNGAQALDQAAALFSKSQPWLVTYVPKLFKPWWIELSDSRIVNCHSAVLPYARGVHAIENMAAKRDIEAFRRAAGVTIHYIDKGVDTGPIIRAERLADPFEWQSLWELKACLYQTGIDCYVRTVKDIMEQPHTVPAGICPSKEWMGPNFRRKDFTEDRRRQAEEGYSWMRRRHLLECVVS